ncbi:MAG: hypothetical protein WDO24_27970 [Pseudomonadota bacterium]
MFYLGTNRHFREVEGYPFVPKNGTITRNTYLEIFHHESQIGDHGDVTLSGNIAGHRNDLATGFDVNSVDFKDGSNTPFGGTSVLSPFSFSPGNFINLTGTKPQFRTQDRSICAVSRGPLQADQRSRARRRLAPRPV